MTCDQVERQLDAFMDAELPGPTLLAIARHAGACPTCEDAVRELAALHEAVDSTVRTDGERLDLSGVWPAVAARVARVDARRAWTRRARTAPLWGGAVAAAAAALFWLQSVPPQTTRVATPARPNSAVIERLDSDAVRFELRRERKLGTTLIMVSAPGGEGPE